MLVTSYYLPFTPHWLHCFPMVGVDKCILSTIQDFMQKNYTKICVLSFCGISGSNGCICWLATSLEKGVTLVGACPEAMRKLGCLCWLAASPEQWENLVVYVGLCSSRVDKNLTIIAVIQIHNSNVVELLIFETLTPNLAYAADEIFTKWTLAQCYTWLVLMSL